MLKWWFILFVRGISVGGPYETDADCVAALKVEIARPIVDPGFDGARADGLCFQAIRPEKK